MGRPFASVGAQDVTTDNGARLLTTGEAAAILGVTDSTIKRWVRGGRLACVVTPGGHRRYRSGDVERLRSGQDRAFGLGATLRPVHPAPNRGMDRRLLGANQVAAMLDVAPKTVSRWSDQGYLRTAVTTAGGHRRWRPTDVQRFAETYGLAPEAGA